MAAIPTSPAVVFLERDNSSYPANIDSSIVGIVGYATKGPLDTPTLITSQENLVNTFGKPNESIPGQGLEAALEILETTNQIRYVRVAPDNATTASSLVTIGSCPAVLVSAGSMGDDGAGIGTAGANINFFFRISVKDSDGVEVQEDTLYNVLSSLNVPTGYGQASALSRIIGNGSNPSDKVGVFYDQTSTDSLVGYNNGLIVGSFAGANARLSVSAYSGTLTSLVGAPILKALHSSGSVTSTGYVSSITANGYTVTSVAANSLFYKSQALYKGSGYNLGTDTNTGQTSGLSIELDAYAGPYSNVTVNSDGITAETFKVSLIDDQFFIEKAINTGDTNLKSTLIKGEIGIANQTSATPTANANFWSIACLGAPGGKVTLTNGEVSASPRFLKFVDGTYSMTNGSNGTVDETATSSFAEVIGTASAKTGMYALDDDNLNISIALVPGIYDQDVQNNLITLAETSQNFIAVVAPPIGLNNVQEATNWMNGKGDLGRTAAINSSWAAVYWPHVQVYNVFDQKDMWYDAAIYAVRQMTFTDNVAESWFAPAGFRRGRLTKPTATEIALNQGDRDSLYVTNLNPIVNFVPDGITIFGQKTAQRAATALDRVNVRRLMIYLRKVLLQAGRIDLFEPNDQFTWDQVKAKAQAVLSDIQNRRGITDFRVICDETTNTPLRVDRNELWCKILLKPTKTAEWIVFEVNLTSQSAKFNG